MDMRKYAATTFLKPEHVSEEREIAHIKEGKYDKPDLYFTTGEVLSLHGTNVGILMREYGADSEDWVGKKVKLGKVKYQGELQDSVIIEPTSPPLSPEEKKKAADALGDEIPF
jgi:hypothetical protein